MQLNYWDKIEHIARRTLPANAEVSTGSNQRYCELSLVIASVFEILNVGQEIEHDKSK